MAISVYSKFEKNISKRNAIFNKIGLHNENHLSAYSVYAAFNNISILLPTTVCLICRSWCLVYTAHVMYYMYVKYV